MRAFVLVAALSFNAMMLAGCMSGEEGLAAQNAKDDQQCLSYGAKRGTDAYVACRTQLSTTRTTASNAIVTSGPTHCMNIGGGIISCN